MGLHQPAGALAVRYCSSQEINSLVTQLVREGWRFRRGTKHGRLQPPIGQCTLTVPRTPSDRRAWMNFRRDVRHIAAKALASQNYSKEST